MSYKHIRINSLFHMAVANLIFKKLRSALTILGIAIGSGAIFLLISLGLGVQNLVVDQITKGQSVNSIDVNVSSSQLLRINKQTIEDFKAINSVNDASGYYTNIGKLTIKGTTAEVVTYGVDNTYIQSSNFSLLAGDMIDTNNQDQIVISSSILEAMGITDKNSLIGSKVTLKIEREDQNTIEQQFSVVGVTDSPGSSETFISSAVFNNAGVEDYAGAKVLAKDREGISDIRKVVESRGFNTSSPVDTLNQVDQFFGVLRIVLVGFGSIGMVIAVLGMINTLTVSLLERTREVALMNAIGARPNDMSRLFIMEALLLSFVGVITGIVTSRIIGFVVDVLLNNMTKNRGAISDFTIFSSPYYLVIATVVVALVVGFVVSIIPARRAKYINVLDALRKE
ncbi:ABC transporter permease [Candidatus Saccharibacteria bacterium]|nr:ABC transporter permease [Candidatus Saccharibacteria bacterium]